MAPINFSLCVLEVVTNVDQSFLLWVKNYKTCQIWNKCGSNSLTKKKFGELTFMYNSTLLLWSTFRFFFHLNLCASCSTNSNKHFETLYKYNSLLSCKYLWTTPVTRRVNKKTGGGLRPLWWTGDTSHSEVLWSFYCHLFCNTVLPDNVAP